MNLGDDVLQHILSFLPLCDVLSVSQCNKECYNRVGHRPALYTRRHNEIQCLYNRLTNTYYGIHDPKLSLELALKLQYIERYILVLYPPRPFSLRLRDKQKELQRWCDLFLIYQCLKRLDDAKSCFDQFTFILGIPDRKDSITRIARDE